MTGRQKKGIGFVASGILSALVGAIFLGTSVTPDWLGYVLSGVGLLANLFGVTVVTPNTEE